MRTFSSAATVLLLVAGSGFGQVQYAITDLGTLPGCISSSAVGINASGQVAGNSLPASGRSHAFLWSNGTMTDLGSVYEGYEWTASGLNDIGQVVGTTRIPSNNVFIYEHACLYSNGTLTDLGTLNKAPNTCNSEAYGINNFGQVVGTSDLAYSDPGPYPFLYSNGEMFGIWTAYKKCYSRIAINSGGRVVYTADLFSADLWTYNGTTNFIWVYGTITALGTLPGFSISQAFGINDGGQVVGLCQTNSPSTAHAVLWGNGTITDLGILPGCSGSSASAIIDARINNGYIL